MSFIGRLENVDLRLLRVFNAIAENGGISGAADRLSVDRSTISRQLTDLETRLQLRLCERSRAGFSLTEEGRIVLAKTQDLFGAVRSFNMHINDIHKELSGDLIIAVSDTSVLNEALNMPAVLRKFNEEAPNVRYTVKSMSPDDIERAVNNRSCSLGIMTSQATTSTLDFLALYEEENALYVHRQHPLFSRHTLTLEAIKKHEIAVLQYETYMTRLVRELELKVGPVTNNTEGLLSLIQTGKFLGILPTFYAKIFDQSGDLRRVHLPETTYATDMGILAHPRDRSSSMIKLFSNILRDSLSN